MNIPPAASDEVDDYDNAKDDDYEGDDGANDDDEEEDVKSGTLLVLVTLECLWATLLTGPSMVMMLLVLRVMMMMLVMMVMIMVIMLMIMLMVMMIRTIMLMVMMIMEADMVMPVNEIDFERKVFTIKIWCRTLCFVDSPPDLRLQSTMESQARNNVTEMLRLAEIWRLAQIVRLAILRFPCRF